MIKTDNAVLNNPNLKIENTISVDGNIRINGGTLVFSNRDGTIKAKCVILESRFISNK